MKMPAWWAEKMASLQTRIIDWETFLVLAEFQDSIALPAPPLRTSRATWQM